MAIVKDSSIWDSEDAFDAVRKKDMSVRIGIVREARLNQNNNDIAYIVEVFSTQNQLPIFCRRLERFGGVFNYEEYTHHGYTWNNSSASAGQYKTRAGDIVVVAYANGDSREGFILGSLKHPARQLQNSDPKDIHYTSEFNGVNTSINASGEFQVTFKGIPTNNSVLGQGPNGQTIPAPTYDTSVGGTNYKFDMNGGWTISDAATSNPQSIYIDKTNGIITVTSGQVVITIDKNAQSITTTAQDITTTASNSITESTDNYSLSATSTYKVTSPKIAIGGGGTELLDQISQLITALGNLAVPIEPVTGPTLPFSSAPTWVAVLEVQTAIDGIKGSL